MTYFNNLKMGLLLGALVMGGCDFEKASYSPQAINIASEPGGGAASQIIDPASLTVASWNIANLAQSVGVELRGGYARSQDDYNDIQEIITAMDADIIAFQEIGSKAALRQVLDTDLYNFEFETRCLANEKKCDADTGDIYTAIAWKKTFENYAKVFQIDELSVDHTNQCGITRAVRGAVGVRLDIPAGVINIPSLHIKASCKDDKIEEGTADDCETQRRQFTILSEWMKSIPEGEGIVLAGDFNRKLFKPRDTIARDFFPDSLSATLPPVSTRVCWSDEKYKINFRAMKAQAYKNIPGLAKDGLNPFIYNPSYNKEIDFIIYDGLPENISVSSQQIEMSGYYDFRNPRGTLTACDGSIKTFEDKKTTFVFGDAFPSDHCPIMSRFAFRSNH